MFLSVRYTQNFTKTLDNDISFLHVAVMKESASLVEAALDHGLDVNIKNKNLETPLLAALLIPNKEASVKLARTLLEHGADVNLQDNFGYTPLHEVARMNSDEDLSNELLTLILNAPNCNVNIQSNFGESPLHVAATPKIAARLIRSGADVNSRDCRRRTPLHRQVANSQICKILIDNKAEINSKMLRGITPLYEAIYTRALDTVALLLDNNADPNIKCDHKVTSVQMACEMMTPEQIRERLWSSCTSVNLMFMANFDKSAIPRVLKTWNHVATTRKQILNLILNALSVHKAQQLNSDTCGQLVAQYIMNNIEIFSYRNIKKINRKFSGCLRMSLMSFVIKSCDYGTSKKKDVESAVAKLLNNGVVPCFADLQLIYQEFGDCPLLHTLLKSTPIARVRNGKNLQSFADMLTNVTTNLNNVFRTGQTSVRIAITDFYNIYTIARYSTLPRALAENLVDMYKELCRTNAVLQNNTYQKEVEEIKRSSGVPSLLELSRNSVRVQMSKRYDIESAYDLCRVLNALALPPTIVDIVMLDIPINYKIKSLPFVISV